MRQQTSNTIKKYFLGILFFSSFLVAGQVHALTISPARIVLETDPGTTVSGEVILINEQESAQTFYASFENFEANGDSGSPSFTEGSEGLASWITSDKIVNLAAGETKTVQFSITVPPGTNPGGYFAAVFWGTNPPDQSVGGSVSVGARIGALVLLRVSGDIKEEGGINLFEVVDGKKVFSFLPVAFTYTFRNSGGDRLFPEGTITIRNTMGKEVAILDANEVQGNILPGSVRRFSVRWGDEPAIPPKGFFQKLKQELSHFSFGYYKAELRIVYGTQATETTSILRFWIIPWRSILVAFIVGLLLFRRWYKNRNKIKSEEKEISFLERKIQQLEKKLQAPLVSNTYIEKNTEEFISVRPEELTESKVEPIVKEDDIEIKKVNLTKTTTRKTVKKKEDDTPKHPLLD